MISRDQLMDDPLKKSKTLIVCSLSFYEIFNKFLQKRTPGVTLKDLDFLENKTKLLVKFEEYEEFMNIVRSDAKFFEENNIIDYSMLVGIHNNSSALAEYSE